MSKFKSSRLPDHPVLHTFHNFLTTFLGQVGGKGHDTCEHGDQVGEDENVEKVIDEGHS